MTIRHLKIFIQVAETGKMSAAAKKLLYLSAYGKPGHP